MLFVRLPGAGMGKDKEVLESAHMVASEVTPNDRTTKIRVRIHIMNLCWYGMWKMEDGV